MANFLTEEIIKYASQINDDKDILEFKGRNFKDLDELEWFQFCKANKTFREPGLSSEELVMLHNSIKVYTGSPLTIVETGICFGVTTRYFVVRNLKYGGELHSFETHLRPDFQKAMEEIGLWNQFHVLGHSMKAPWEQNINFLFIDSEHAMSDALGEYMRFRVWLTGESMVGFHDTDNCYGVKRAVEIANEIDDLELVGEVTGRLSAGIKIFKLKGLGQKQIYYNNLYKNGKL